MLQTIAIILLVLWLLGLVTSTALGGIHTRVAGGRDCAFLAALHPLIAHHPAADSEPWLWRDTPK